jgi:hypothetical protein
VRDRRVKDDRNRTCTISDLDCIVDDALWRLGVWEGLRGLYNWGPPPPPSFVLPDEVAAMVTGAHNLR